MIHMSVAKYVSILKALICVLVAVDMNLTQMENRATVYTYISLKHFSKVFLLHRY